MDGSGPERPADEAPAEAGGSRPGPPRGVIAAAVVLVALLAIGVAVVVGLRLSGSYLGEEVASGPLPTSTRTPVTRPDRSTRSTTTSTATATTARRATAACDARAINADLGYPRSGSRIIDCGGGWAVMASEHSGDPYWVSFRDGRWRTVRDVSMYLMTCPDEAIAKGAPAWLADKHLNTCPSLNPPTPVTRPSVRPTPPPPPGSPTRPTIPTPPASPPSSSTPVGSTGATSTTTTTPTTTTTTTAAAGATSRSVEVG